MLKKIALLTTAGIVMLISVVSFLPTSYQLTVHNSNYYGNCADNSINTENQCKPIDPPETIVKREPFIRAWWDKTQTERQFTTKDVSTKWLDKGTFGLGKEITGTLAVSVVLLELLILSGIVYLFVSTLIKAFRLKGSEKIAWICLIIFVFPLGSIIFALTKPQVK
jgi:hypothetical protein